MPEDKEAKTNEDDSDGIIDRFDDTLREVQRQRRSPEEIAAGYLSHNTRLIGDGLWALLEGLSKLGTSEL